MTTLLRGKHISVYGVILLFCISFGTEGCYSVRVGTKNVATKDTVVNAASYAWGLVEPNPMVGDDVYLTALWNVEVYQTFWQKFFSVITIGIYSPVTIHCYFAVPDQEINR